MMKINKKKLSVLFISMALVGTTFAAPGSVHVRPVPVKPAPRRGPPPPPPPHRPHVVIEVRPRPHHHHKVELEGRLRVRYRHGRDTVILETRRGDYILYPDDYIRDPLTFRDLTRYENEIVGIEGYEYDHSGEIYVTDIWSNSRVRSLDDDE